MLFQKRGTVFPSTASKTSFSFIFAFEAAAVNRNSDTKANVTGKWGKCPTETKGRANGGSSGDGEKFWGWGGEVCTCLWLGVILFLNSPGSAAW